MSFEQFDQSAVEITDEQGLPGVKLAYKLDANSHNLVRFHQEKAKESLEAAGAYDTVVAPFIRQSGWHLLGTAKMGTDPKTSVVGADGRAHDHPNLFIFDGSVWPTSAGMNPTATIMALSLKWTDQLIHDRRNQRVAA